jgi:hypothetical protein
MLISRLNSTKNICHIMQGKEWAQIQLKLLDSEQQAGHQASLIAITINLRLSSS